MARKRHLFFRRILSFLRLIKSQLASWLSKKVAYLSLLLSLFVLAAFLPVIAQETVSQNSSSATILIKQAELNYNLGEYQRAAELLQQATNELENNRQLQAIALTNLSLVYQQQGEWQLAQAAINESLTILQQDTKNNLALLARAWEVQGKLQLAIGKASEAITSWQKAIDNYENIEDKEGKIRTQIHQTVAFQELGLYREAFKQLTTIKPEAIEGNLVRGAWLRNLGNIVRVVGNVNEIESILPTNICQSNEEESTDYLKISACLLRNSLATIEISNSPQLKAEVSLDLGNTYTAMYQRAKDAFERGSDNDDRQTALEKLDNAVDEYQKVSELRTKTKQNQLQLTFIQARLNEISLLIDAYQWIEENEQKSVKDQILLFINQGNLSEIKSSLDQKQLTGTIAIVYAQINLAQTMNELDSILGKEWQKQFPDLTTSENLLQDAIAKAQMLENINDSNTEQSAYKRLQAYALGSLGKLYEQQNQWKPAFEKTEEAIRLTEEIQAPELAYQWEWQLGRLLRNQGEIESAVAAYEVAAKSLELSRQNFLILQSEERFALQNSINTFYRELIALLLPKDNPNPDQENLQKSIYYIESLQLAELENFLKCNLTDIETVQLEPNSRENININSEGNLIALGKHFLEKTSQTALIHTIELRDREQVQLALILQLPENDRLIYQTTVIDSNQFKETLEKALNSLKSNNFALGDIEPLNYLYKWLVEPLESNLEQKRINSLVFVLDNNLRRIPMAAIYDGENFLVKKYAISLTSSIKFLTLQNYSIKNPQVLIAAAVKERPPEFGKLRFADSQIEKVITNIRNVEVLFNGEFVKGIFREKLKSSSYDIIHLVTHGRFSSDPKETVILTDDDFDYLLNIDEFGNLLQSRNRSKILKLLILSACETASGDDRAVLGIAGVAVKSGAASTIAPVWNADQSSTTLFIEKFYEHLGRSNSPTKALQLAQISMLEDPNEDINNPYHWAPFVLVGY
ncbi:MAG: CHAT domain-containing protein [Kamptonema sp. SIO1D9]|nr:CHAT domain-containing protein [Kamptonema sp. SIO1D9]